VRELLRARPENAMFALASVDPDATLGVKKQAAARELWANGAALGDLQARLHAEASQSLLVVLQALDTGGKDGTIKHAMSAICKPPGAGAKHRRVGQGAGGSRSLARRRCGPRRHASR
jgi:polyphosphate kinase 2 (PPK2 family)